MHRKETGIVCLCTLVERKRKRYVNAVDVVKRLHDPTDPSTERTAPLCSAHVHLDDVPRALDPVEGRGRVLKEHAVPPCLALVINDNLYGQMVALSYI